MSRNPKPSIDLSPMAVLDKARAAVPAVNYALGLAGVAAAAAIIIALVGRGPGGIILIGSSFLGMVLLFIFSRLVAASSPSVQFAGIVMVWAVIAFFATFLVFTTTAVVFTWPCNWAQFLDMTTSCIPKIVVKPNEEPATASPTRETQITHFTIVVRLSSGETVRREWVQQTPDEWVEKYSESGVLTYYDVKGRITLDGCPGTKMGNRTGPSHLVFVPDKGCPGMPFRINDANAGWGFASSITDY